MATDVVTRDGLPVTSPARSIVDAAEAGMAPEQVVLAAHQAVERGLATSGQLGAAARGRGSRIKQLVQRALDEDRGTMRYAGAVAFSDGIGATAPESLRGDLERRRYARVVPGPRSDSGGPGLH